jgi:hypothetical protein
MELVYRSKPGDVALILYRRDAAGLHGVRYTHTALIAQAEDGEHWLGAEKESGSGARPPTARFRRSGSCWRRGTQERSS